MDNLLCLRPVVLFPEDSVCSSYRLSLVFKYELRVCQDLLGKLETILVLLLFITLQDPLEERVLLGREDDVARHADAWLVSLSAKR